MHDVIDIPDKLNLDVDLIIRDDNRRYSFSVSSDDTKLTLIQIDKRADEISDAPDGLNISKNKYFVEAEKKNMPKTVPQNIRNFLTDRYDSNIDIDVK